MGMGNEQKELGWTTGGVLTGEREIETGKDVSFSGLGIEGKWRTTCVNEMIVDGEGNDQYWGKWWNMVEMRRLVCGCMDQLLRR